MKQARGLTSVEDVRALYRDWAEDYDHDITGELKFTGGDRIASLLTKHAPGKSIRILDVGCGTGLVGETLQRMGFSAIDGLDLSPAMLEVARTKSIYGALMEADLIQTIDLADGAYDAVISAGTFTSGHVDASRLGEVLRLVRPGGLLACVVAADFWHQGGFAREFARLSNNGKLRMAHDDTAAIAETGSSVGHFIVAERVA